MRRTIWLFILGLFVTSAACSLLVSFDQSEPRCDMVPPDCSVTSCLEKPECAPVECSIDVIYYDSPPSCPPEMECFFVSQTALDCVPDYHFSEGNFYDRCAPEPGPCPHGSICLQGLPDSPSVCVPYCSKYTHPRCPDGGRCFDVEDAAAIDVCFRDDNCDPVKNRGCKSGHGCYFIPTGDTTHTTCLPSGKRTEGEPCSITWDCDGGHVCSDVVAGTEGNCFKVCGKNEDCQYGKVCRFLGEYGVCRWPVEPM